MPRENLPRQVWNRQTKLTFNYWLAALVKKESVPSTKPTRIATGIVCHPDTEQNRPYKILWPCRGLNWIPTAPQTRTLPVCHTTPVGVFQDEVVTNQFWKFPLLHLYCINMCILKFAVFNKKSFGLIYGLYISYCNAVFEIILPNALGGFETLSIYSFCYSYRYC